MKPKRKEFAAWEKVMLAQIVSNELSIISMKREMKATRALVSRLRSSLAAARKDEAK